MFPIRKYKYAQRTYVHGSWTYYNARHRGEDLIVPEGTKIYAPFDGFAKARTSKTVGKSIRFTFDCKGKKYVMRFLHLSAWETLGEVKQGALIGYSGNTGKSTNPHIHLDICPYPFLLHPFSRFIDPRHFDWKCDKVKNMSEELKEQVRRLHDEVRKLTSEVLSAQRERDALAEELAREKAEHKETVQYRFKAEEKLDSYITKYNKCREDKLDKLSTLQKIRILLGY